MKKLLALLLSLVLCVSLAIPAFAADGTSNSNIIPDNEVQNYALNFMTTSQNNENITIDDFIHLYDTTDQLTGYYVTFTDNGTPAGYVLLSLISDADPIVEFAFERSGPLSTNSAPNEVMAITNSIASNDNQDAKILYTGAGQLYVETKDNALYSLYDQEYIPAANSISSGNKVDIYDGIINWDEANIDGDPYKITDFGAGTDYWLMTDFSSGGVCTPTAATNVLWYWGKQRGCDSVMDKVSSQSTNTKKAKAIFDIMYDAMGTSTEDGTPDANILDGYKEFFGEASGKGAWAYKKISDGSSFSSYKTELNNNCPIHLVLHTNDGIFDKGDGHCVMNFGYAKSTTGTQYLFVMDGWNTYGRFVKFNYYPYFFGYKIWVA